MSDSGGVKPPGSGQPTGSSSQDFQTEKQTKFGKAFEVQGDSGVKRFARKWFPQMSEKQLDEFEQRFMMTMITTIQKQLNQELQQARKAAKRLKRAEEGDD